MTTYPFVIFLLILMYITLFTQGWSGIAVLLIMQGAKKRRPIDISHLETSPSNKLQSTIEKLSGLGFTRLGQVRVIISGNQSSDGWIFISSDKWTHAEVSEAITDLVVFTTVYSDNAVVETSFPLGERIEAKNFRSRTITSDIEKAYLYHIQQIEDFIKLHGIPRNIENMRNYLYWDVMYRERYVWRKFSRNFWISLVKVLAFGYAIAATLIAVASWLQQGMTITLLNVQLLILLKIIFPAALVAYTAPFIAAWTGRREARSA